MTIQVVINNLMGNYLQEQFKKREEEAYRMFNHYAAEIVKYFMNIQGGNGFWTNRTYALIKSFYSQVLASKEELVLQFGYTGAAKNKYTEEEYAKYIEYDHGGKFAALPTILHKFADLLIKDLKILYGDVS